MPASSLQLLCLCAAFWVAVLGYRGGEPLRFVAALVVCALCAHLGWALLRADQVAAHPSAILDPRAGYCVLFAPLGMLLAAPWRAGGDAASTFLSDAFETLPPALAAARMGCLIVGCCAGVEAEGAWLSRHPVALYEIAGLAMLHLALRRTPRPLVAAGFCAGFGGLRLLLEPLRVAPMATEPLLPAPLVAGLWLAGGALSSCRLLRPAFAAASSVCASAARRSPHAPMNTHRRVICAHVDDSPQRAGAGPSA